MDSRIVRTYAAIVGITLLALFIINVFNISYPLTVENKTSTDLAVVGEGKVDVVPDTATINLGVVIENAKSATSAEQELASKNNTVIAAIKKLGIKEQDIKTSNYSVNPDYYYGKNTNTEKKYTANVNIIVKIHDVDRAAEIASSATKAGANQIGNIEFVVDKPEKFREQARDRAIINAKEQAAALAKKLGIRLGRVVNIVESSDGSGPVPYMQKDTLSIAESAPVADLSPGSQTVVSTVTLYFEKK